MSRPLLPIAAAVGLAAGVLAAGWSIAATPRRLAVLLRQYVDLRALREMAVPLAEPAAARAILQDAPVAQGNAADWLASAAPAWTPALRDEKADPVIPGWNVRRVALAREAVPLADLATLIAAGEGARPPWRVGELVLEAAGDAAARTELTLERLERVAP